MRTKLLKIIRKHADFKFKRLGSFGQDGYWIMKTKRGNYYSSHEDLTVLLEKVMVETLGTVRTIRMIRKNDSKKKQRELKTKWNKIK